MKTITPAQVQALAQDIRQVVREERVTVRMPDTPAEVLAHLALEAGTSRAQVRLIVREICRLAGLDRGIRDLRANAESACHFLVEMTEVEL